MFWLVLHSFLLVTFTDLIGLFYESRGRWLEASDVYLIEDHINILLQYLTELPYSPTPGLFLTRTGYTDVSRTVWMDSVFTQLHVSCCIVSNFLYISYLLLMFYIFLKAACRFWWWKSSCENKLCMLSHGWKDDVSVHILSPTT